MTKHITGLTGTGADEDNGFSYGPRFYIFPEYIQH